MIIENRDEFDNWAKTVSQATILDARLSHSALGLWLRLISKPKNWKISIAGLIAQFPKDKKDSLKSDLKELIKYRYLQRIPQPRVGGRIVAPVLHLFHRPFSEKELTDEQTDFFFSNAYTHGSYDSETIQKIFPELFSEDGTLKEGVQKIFPELFYRGGFTAAVNPPLVSNNKEENKEEKKELPKGSSKKSADAPFFPPPDPSHENEEILDCIKLANHHIQYHESKDLKKPRKPKRPLTDTCPDDQRAKLEQKFGKPKADYIITLIESHIKSRATKGYADWTHVLWAQQEAERYFSPKKPLAKPSKPEPQLNYL